MFDTLIVNPMINALLVLYNLLFNNYVLAIAVFTILIRLITLPLNMRQQRSMQRTQEMQPQIQAIQKKYKDNPQRMQEEFKNIGYNPTESLMGCLPLLIQMPILFGLYRAIMVTLGSTPQAMFELTQRTYSFIDLTPLLPIKNFFLWLNLGQPDPFYVLPVLVFGTMYLQQKLLTPQTAQSKDKKDQNDPAQAMSKSMQTTMPLMFGFFALSFPSGLSIYFILSNLIGIAQGYYMRQTTKKDQASGAGGALKEKSPTVIEQTPSSADLALAEVVDSDLQPASSSNPKPDSAKAKSKRKRRTSKSG